MSDLILTVVILGFLYLILFVAIGFILGGWNE